MTLQRKPEEHMLQFCAFQIGSRFKDQVLFVLFVLRLNVPVNNFSVMSGRSHRFLGN